MNGSGRSIADGSAGADNSLRMRPTASQNEGGDKPLYGPARPTHLQQYGSQAAPSWGFDALDRNQPSMADDDDAGERLLGEVHNDADSNAADNGDGDSGLGDDYDMSNSYDNFEDTGGEDYTDDHSFYETAGMHPDDQGNMLHVEHAGGVGGNHPSPEADEIRIEDEEMKDATHEKGD